MSLSAFQRILLFFIVTLEYQVLAIPSVYRSEWADVNPLYTTIINLSNSPSTPDFKTSFFVWVIPMMGNSVLTTQQIARISRDADLSITNFSTSEILLITIDQTNFVIESSVFITNDPLKPTKYEIPLSSISNLSHGVWTYFEIQMNQKNQMTVMIGSVSKIFTITPAIADVSLYFQLGRQLWLDLLSFSGFYYADITSPSLPQIASNPIPTPTNFYESGQFSSNIILFPTPLGTPYRYQIQSVSSSLISTYQIQFKIILKAEFPLSQQILRISADISIHDERSLGYCIVCVYVEKSKLSILTFSYDYTDGLQYQILQLTALDLFKEYTFILEYQQSSQTVDVFQYTSSMTKLGTISSINQPALYNYDVTYGGQFYQDQFFSGIMSQLIINYGSISPVSSSPINICQDLCSKCDSTNLSNCLDCKISSLDSHKEISKCACKTDSFFDQSQQCAPCNSQCKTCSYLSTQCTSCDTPNQNRELIQSTSTCDCITGFYDNGISGCSHCHTSCASCLGPGSTQCTECQSGMIINAKGECVCQDGYFYQSTSCKPCLSSCETCTNDSTCSTCFENYSLNQEQKCICSDGFYFSSTKTCEECVENCKTCFEETKTICNQCQTGYRLNGDQQCEESLFLETTFGSQRNWVKEWSYLFWEYLVLSFIILDFLINIYNNQLGFSKVFRIQQYVLKVFYLKLIATRFTFINYFLLSALSNFNGIINIYYYINPFINLPYLKSTQIGSKIYLERIPSSLMQCAGGVIFLLFIFTAAGIVLAILTKKKQMLNNKTQPPDSKVNREGHSLSLDNSFNIESPLNICDEGGDIHGLKYVSNNKKNGDHNEALKQQQNKEQTPQNRFSLENINRNFQHVYWHYHEYAMSVVCFASVLHIVGSAQNPSAIVPQNFLAYVFIIYYLFICLIGRSFIIRKPKNLQDLLIFRDIAIENEKFMERKNRAKNNEDEEDNDQSFDANGNFKKKNIGSPESENGEKDSPDSDKAILDIQNDDFKLDKSEKNINIGIKKSNSIFDKSYDSSASRKKRIEQVSSNEWKPYLSDSVSLQGLFECLHMEYINGFKGCKFYFWFYGVNYLFLAVAVCSPNKNSNGQYSLMLLFQVQILITTFFRPYQDLIESVKNVVDNVFFFVGLLLQYIMSSKFHPISEQYTISSNLEEEINKYAYASFSCLLFPIIAFPILSIVQIVQRRKAKKLEEDEKVKAENEQKMQDDELEKKKKEIEQNKKKSSPKKEEGYGKKLSETPKSQLAHHKSQLLFHKLENIEEDPQNESKFEFFSNNKGANIELQDFSRQQEEQKKNIIKPSFDPNHQLTRYLSQKRENFLSIGKENNSHQIEMIDMQLNSVENNNDLLLQTPEIKNISLANLQNVNNNNSKIQVPNLNLSILSTLMQRPKGVQQTKFQQGGGDLTVRYNTFNEDDIDISKDNILNNQTFLIPKSTDRQEQED